MLSQDCNWHLGKPFDYVALNAHAFITPPSFTVFHDTNQNYKKNCTKSFWNWVMKCYLNVVYLDFCALLMSKKITLQKLLLVD